jgi:hypothetical protein
MIKILDSDHRHILVCQLLAEYIYVTEIMAIYESLPDLYIDYDYAGITSLFTDYISPALQPIADSRACRSILYSYTAMLEDSIKDKCTQFLDAYRSLLQGVRPRQVKDFILDKGKLWSFFDCRNYSLYALLHPHKSVETREPIVIYSAGEHDMITGHIFIHDFDTSMELIGIQTDLYHNLVGQRLGFSRDAFDYVLTTLLPNYPDVIYVYAVAWKVISDILVTKYGFSTMTHDTYQHTFQLTGPDGNTETFDKRSRDMRHRLLIHDFQSNAHERRIELCNPSCYILTLKIV